MERGYYADHALTIARHPSETDERMMLRVLAFALHADADLSFGKGLSTDDEPDLWQRDLTGAIGLWIDVGQPDEKLVRRACGRARQVVVYAYGRGAELWWGRSRAALERMRNLTVASVPVADESGARQARAAHDAAAVHDPGRARLAGRQGRRGGGGADDAAQPAPDQVQPPSAIIRARGTSDQSPCRRQFRRSHPHRVCLRLAPSAATGRSFFESCHVLFLARPVRRARARRHRTRLHPAHARSRSQAIPAVLAGGDLLAGAQTGTGKTAGFVLPMLQRLSTTPAATPRVAVARKKPIRALILTPTRELAAQVEESVRVYGKYAKQTSMVMFGGVGISPQTAQLQRGVDILVATPGRLLDHQGQGNLDLSRVEILVLDEADRMLDMGFIRDIKRILALLPKKRQNLLFSATFSDEISELADSLLNAPALIEVARRNSTVEIITQTRASGRPRPQARAALAPHQDAATGTRCSSSRAPSTAPTSSPSSSNHDGITALAIHGNKSQGARTRALAEFKDAQPAGAGRHRHRRARHRHRPAAARRQLRPAQRAPRLRAPDRPHRPRRRDRRGDLARLRRRARIPARHREADQAHAAARRRARIRAGSARARAADPAAAGPRPAAPERRPAGRDAQRRAAAAVPQAARRGRRRGRGRSARRRVRAAARGAPGSHDREPTRSPARAAPRRQAARRRRSRASSTASADAAASRRPAAGRVAAGHARIADAGNPARRRADRAAVPARGASATRSMRWADWPEAVSDALTRFVFAIAIPALLFRLMSDFSRLPPVDARLLDRVLRRLPRRVRAGPRRREPAVRGWMASRSRSSRWAESSPTTCCSAFRSPRSRWATPRCPSFRWCSCSTRCSCGRS